MKHFKKISFIATIVFGITTLLPLIGLAQTSGTGNIGEHLKAGDLGIDFIGPSSFNFETVDINSPSASYDSYYKNLHSSEERIQIHDARYRGGFQLQVQATDYIDIDDPTKIIPVNNLAIVTEQGSTENYAEENNGPNLFKSNSGGFTPLLGSIGNNIQITKDLPFAFIFYGTAYKQIHICSNGHISFKANCNISEIENIINATSGIPRIVPYYKNLTTAIANGGIYFEDNSNDSNPAKRMVRIRWAAAPANNTREKIGFEVLLYKDNHIAFQYGDATHFSDSGLGPAVGITNGDGNNFLISTLNDKEKALDLLSTNAVFITGMDANEITIDGTSAIIAPLNGLADNDSTYTNFVDASTPLNALYGGACANTQGRVGTYTLYPGYRLHIPNVTEDGIFKSTITWTIIDESLNC